MENSAKLRYAKHATTWATLDVEYQHLVSGNQTLSSETCRRLANDIKKVEKNLRSLIPAIDIESVIQARAILGDIKFKLHRLESMLENSGTETSPRAKSLYERNSSTSDSAEEKSNQIENSKLSDTFSVLRTLQPSLQGSIMYGVRTSDQLPVAIKTCHKSCMKEQLNLKGERVLEDPLNEVYLMKKINSNPHPNIIHFLGAYEDDHSLHLVMEYVDGEELYQRVARSARVAEAEALAYFRQLVSAVAHLHGLGICHLDISLENILISDGLVKICDFGLGREFTNVPFPGNTLVRPGKLLYMDPLIYAGQDFFGDQADVFALGVVLFILLLGFPPFEVPAMSDARFRILYEDSVGELLKRFNMKDLVSENAVALLEMMLCPGERRKSAAAVEALIRIK